MLMVYDGTWSSLWYCLGRSLDTEYGMDYCVGFTRETLRLARSLIGLEVTIDGLYTSEDDDCWSILARVMRATISEAIHRRTHESTSPAGRPLKPS